jgi:hypothetical protein
VSQTHADLARRATMAARAIELLGQTLTLELEGITPAEVGEARAQYMARAVALCMVTQIRFEELAQNLRTEGFTRAP